MNHTVSKDDADQFARSKGIEHVQASALSGNNVDYIFTTLAESKFRLHYSLLIWLTIFLEMMAKKAESEPRPGPAGRRTGRNQLRVEGVQDFNPAGGSAVRLSRASEKQVADKKKGGCCGGKKDWTAPRSYM